MPQLAPESPAHQDRDIAKARKLMAQYFAAKEIESTELIIKEQDEE